MASTPKKKPRIVMAIDFGTTSSAMAIALCLNGHEHVTVLSPLSKPVDAAAFMGSSFEWGSRKVPTKVLLDAKSMKLVRFGEEAADLWDKEGLNKDGTPNGKFLLFEHFKMALDFVNNSQNTENKRSQQSSSHEAKHPSKVDQGDKSEAEGGNKRGNKSGNLCDGSASRDVPIASRCGKLVPMMIVLTEMLAHFRKTALARIAAVKTTGKLAVLWVLTVPTAWGHGAKQMMTESAVKAGMRDDGDEVSLALESEAGAVACHRAVIRRQLAALAAAAGAKQNNRRGPHPVSAAANPNAGPPESAVDNAFNGRPGADAAGEAGLRHRYLQPGRRCVVVDAGGGTTDVTKHRVAEVNGGLTEAEHSWPAGPAVGGLCVNRNFDKLLDGTFGADWMGKFYSQFPQDARLLDRAIEALKCTVDPSLPDDHEYLLPAPEALQAHSGLGDLLHPHSTGLRLSKAANSQVLLLDTQADTAGTRGDTAAAAPPPSTTAPQTSSPTKPALTPTTASPNARLASDLVEAGISAASPNARLVESGVSAASPNAWLASARTGAAASVDVRTSTATSEAKASAARSEASALSTAPAAVTAAAAADLGRGKAADEGVDDAEWNEAEHEYLVQSPSLKNGRSRVVPRTEPLPLNRLLYSAGNFRISQKLALAMFAEPVKRIADHVELLCKNDPLVSCVFAIGGFCESPVLRAAIREAINRVNTNRIVNAVGIAEVAALTSSGGPNQPPKIMAVVQAETKDVAATPVDKKILLSSDRMNLATTTKGAVSVDAGVVEYEPVLLVKVERPVEAVLEGAALYGFDPNTIKSRVMRNAVGTARDERARSEEHKKMYVPGLCEAAFRQRLLPPEKDGQPPISDPLCRNHLRFLVRTGEIIGVNECREDVCCPACPAQDRMIIPFYCADNNGTFRIDQPGVHYIGRVEIPMRSQSGGLYRQVKLQVFFGGTHITVKATDVTSGLLVNTNLSFLD
jgi:hypothetical protein